MQWQLIDSAPRDGRLVLVYAPGAHGLNPMMSVCAYHADAGWCIDELRQPTHWMPLPPPPKAKADAQWDDSTMTFRGPIA